MAFLWPTLADDERGSYGGWGWTWSALRAARTTAEAPRRPSDGTAAPLRLIVREDFAVPYVGQRFGDLVGVDGGNELGQVA
jgi:hypothetical protein